MTAPCPSRTRRLLRRLAASRSGVAMTEFALSLPVLLTAGLWGLETANLALTQMAVNQLAIHLADNGSRIGDTSTLQNRKIFESDINDLLYGANLQGGTKLDLYNNGRVIVSSLEVDPKNGKEYIHWQRCKGVKTYASLYGKEGDNMPKGMGPTGEEVHATATAAVIYVEIAYNYQQMVGLTFAKNTEIRAQAAFLVRDSRDMSQVYQRDPLKPSNISKCSVYDATPLV